MKIPNQVKGTILNTTDTLMGLWPRPRPTLTQLERVRIVAHRGYSLPTPPITLPNPIIENTLASFRSALNCGAWGIEFDVRWTKDEVPVILHDTNTQRVFGANCEISSLNFHECRRLFPLLPSLEEVILEFGRKLHLMIEIKETLIGKKNRALTLERILKHLAPELDYHLMCLRATDFFECAFAPMKAMLPIAEFNVAAMSDLAMKNGMAGITGQYLLLGRHPLLKHHKLGQKIGTGFVSSQSVFFREVNRDIDWIFTNHTFKIATIRKNAMKELSGP